MTKNGSKGNPFCANCGYPMKRMLNWTERSYYFCTNCDSMFAFIRSLVEVKGDLLKKKIINEQSRKQKEVGK